MPQKKDCAPLLIEGFPIVPRTQLEDAWSQRSQKTKPTA